MHTKTTRGYHFTPIRMVIKNKQKVSVVRMWRDWNHSALVADQQNSDAPVESSLAEPQKVTYTGTSLAVHWLGSTLPLQAARV